MLAANKGTHYNLGWHRDVIQIPEAEIRDELFSEERHHNSCQINLPLYNEDFLQVVPANHNRLKYKGKCGFFRDQNTMPHWMQICRVTEQVFIEAGSALFYNNNLIHRGYCEMIESPRQTLNMGFHSASRKPTWHFYLLNPDTFFSRGYCKT